MNTGWTIGTALLRGIYIASGAGLLAFLTVWATTNDLKAPIVAGGVSALTALGFRAGIEGMSDKSRDDKHQVRSSDVGHPSQ